MARLVNPSPPLPYAGSSISVSELARFDADLVRMLTFYLRDLAERANASVPLDGSEVMTGDLNLGGNDITNVQTITMPNLILNGFTANAQIEHGRQDGIASTPLIDFHSGATAVDFDSRILASGGTGALGGGDLTISAANLILSQGRLRFPASENPSTDVNTLDDYREGTWTPNIAFGGGSVGITYSQQQGTYIKIGRLVHVIAQMNMTALGSSTGNATVTGLPFTVNVNAPAPIGLYLNMQASVIGMSGLFLNATTTINLYNENAGTQVQLTQANFSAGSIIVIGGSYRV